MRQIIAVLILALAVLALANDLVKEKQTTLNAMQRSYVARDNMIKTFQDNITVLQRDFAVQEKALQDSILKYRSIQALSTGYMMCLQDDIRKLQADTTKVKPDSMKGKKDGKK